MARRADPTPGHQRLLGLAAVAGLSVATALAFGRVFTGRHATLELVAAALASVAIAALFERRGLLLATMASLVGLAFAITWIVLPQTAWYGLPSIQTLRAVGRSLDFVGQQARVRVAPTPALPPLMLAAVTAVWTAAFSSHALAIRAGSPLLAILPPIALVGFADTVLEDGARPFYAIVLLAAALAVVFTTSFAQTTNFNSGGTPGLGRYGIWLVPLAIPLLACADRVGGCGWHSALAVIALVSVAFNVAEYAPRRAERFRQPTPLAAALWTWIPWLDDPLPEVFVERLTGYDITAAPLISAATPSCSKALLIGGRWPPHCAAIPIPAACAVPGTYCYANRARHGAYAFRRVDE